MKLRIAPEAINDIAEIKNYIRNEYDNPAAANRIAAKIKESYKRLKTTPYVGTQLDVGIANDYRFFSLRELFDILYSVRGSYFN
jgi:plasmid stabilization system protein ParE